jgi:hypothetical protein
MTLFDIF